MLEKLKFWGKGLSKETIPCEDCGDKIPPARLKAVPGTVVCVACLADQERKGVGTVKYRMEQSVSFNTGGEVDSVEQHVIKGGGPVKKETETPVD